MGWQDAPLVDDTSAPPIQPGTPPPPEGSAPAWASAPVISEPVQPQQPPVPSMGAVAANAIPKGLANLLNTPVTLANLIMQGIANLPGAGHFSGLQTAAQEPELKANAPMDLAKGAGLVKPENEPQTGPQRIVDMAIQTAIGAAAVPGGGLAQAAKGAAVGAASGAAAQTTKELTGSDLLAIAVGMGTPFAIKSLTDSSKKIIASVGQREVLKEAQQYGFQVEPSSVRTPPSKLESIAGPAPIANQAARNNQELTNQLAAKSLGFPPETAFKPDVLEAARKKASAPYRELDDVFQQAKSSNSLPYFPRYHSASLTDEWVAARQHASELWKSYWADPKIEMKRAAEAASTTVQSIEKDIDMVAKAVGRDDLLPRLLAGRQAYARVNDIEEALNVGSLNISLPKLGKMVDQGKPLSGELAFLGRFAQAFKRVARETETLPPVGVSATDAMVGEGLATMAAANTGNVASAAIGLIPQKLRTAARNKVLSKGYQDKLLQTPTPGPSTGTTAARAGMVGKALASPEPVE